MQSYRETDSDSTATANNAIHPVKNTNQTNAIYNSPLPHPISYNTYDICAISGLVISVINIAAIYIFPFCGCFLGTAGMICSFIGLKSVKYKFLAISGLIFCILDFLCIGIFVIIWLMSETHGFSLVNYLY